jgi:imidazolonepropionase-like amidohydrolase
MRRIVSALVGALLLLPVAGEAQTAPTVGLRSQTVGLHALTGAHVVTGTGQRLEGATILIRDGWIEAVGVGIATPPGARIHDLSGHTIYPGFIEAYGSVGMPTSRPDDEPGALNWNPQTRAFVHAVSAFRDDAAGAADLRALGFTTVHSVPRLGIFSGQGAIFSLGAGEPGSRVLRRSGAHGLSLGRDNRLGGGYPTSAMGAMAFIRQTLLDADWYDRAQRAYASAPRGLRRPDEDLALAALVPVVRGQQAIVVATADEDAFFRANRIASEFNLTLWVRGSGFEYRVLDDVRAAGRPLILPLNFPTTPNVTSEDQALGVSLETLRHYAHAPENPGRLADAGVSFVLTTDGLFSRRDFLPNLRRAVAHGLSPDVALAALTTGPARLLEIDGTHGTIAAGRAANLVVATGDLFMTDASVLQVWVEGEAFQVQGAAPAPTRAADAGRTGEGATLQHVNGTLSFAPVDYTALPAAMDYGRTEIPSQPRHLLVRNATLWTQGQQGRLESADFRVEAGRIVEVGQNLEPRPGSEILDAGGRHVTPGLIDAHIHAGAVGGINETGAAIVPEVRIGDVLTNNNIWMYRQLAGGLTTAHIMHGSANPIGGQNQVVKMRWGAPAEDLKLEGTRPTVKFALGENVVRSPNRYPNTRMGVEQIMRDHFMAAREYEATWAAWERNPRGIPPRRDLRMEALRDILNGTISVQSHSYRQDEILMLIRLAEEMGFKVDAFHHGVEAYRVAPELAAHGAGAVVWSDWSSFKVEAYNATTYNARLLLEAGVVTSLHSDNNEIASRMNWEAGKMLRTGLGEEEALSLVTNGTAALLNIADRVGSIEVGKDADFVIWSGHPLSILSLPDETWVDGRRYFSRVEDEALREAVVRERTDRIQQIRSERGTNQEN